jgi:hypothetical protein
MTNLWLRRFLIRLRSWEYWPFGLVYWPLLLVYVWQAIRCRGLYFFTATNPGIENGGAFFESKWAILKQLPVDVYPKTVFVEAGLTFDAVTHMMQESQLTFPIVAKPDRGERGRGVAVVESWTELEAYRSRYPIDTLLQKQVRYPVELSVFYYRHPDAATGRMTSLCQKAYLTVVGNGRSTVRELIFANDRAFLQWPVLKSRSDLDDVLPDGQARILVRIGNHALGATFYDNNHEIDHALESVFDEISKSLDGFYFGRYDLLCQSLDDLRQGRHFAIVELNGAGAEPAHIYQPGYSYWRALKDIAAHFGMMGDAARANRLKGASYMSHRRYRQLKQAESAYRLRYFTP